MKLFSWCCVPYFTCAVITASDEAEIIRMLSMRSYRKCTWTHWGRDKMAAIFQTTFSNAFSWMKMYEISLWYVPHIPKDQINNILALVQIMAWRRPGNKHYLNQWQLVYICVTRPQWVKDIILFFAGENVFWVTFNQDYCGILLTKYNLTCDTVPHAIMC